MITAQDIQQILAAMGIAVDAECLDQQLERDLGIDSAELADLASALGARIGAMPPPRFLHKRDTLADVIQKLNTWAAAGGLDYAFA